MHKGPRIDIRKHLMHILRGYCGHIQATDHLWCRCEEGHVGDHRALVNVGRREPDMVLWTTEAGSFQHYPTRPLVQMKDPWRVEVACLDEGEELVTRFESHEARDFKFEWYTARGPLSVPTPTAPVAKCGKAMLARMGSSVRNLVCTLPVGHDGMHHDSDNQKPGEYFAVRPRSGDVDGTVTYDDDDAVEMPAPVTMGPARIDPLVYCAARSLSVGSGYCAKKPGHTGFHRTHEGVEFALSHGRRHPSTTPHYSDHSVPTYRFDPLGRGDINYERSIQDAKDDEILKRLMSRLRKS